MDEAARPKRGCDLAEAATAFTTSRYRTITARRSRSCVSSEIFGAYGVVSALEIRRLARGLKVNVEQPSGRKVTGPLGLPAFPRRRVLYRLIWEPSLQQVGRSVRASFGNKIATAIKLLNAVIPDIHDVTYSPGRSRRLLSQQQLVRTRN